MDNRRRFAGFAWAVLGWNALVVMWGALVRATGSGAGCGEHWPLCNGAVVPPAPSLRTLIEFTHRLSSGLALVGVLVLFLWAWRLFPRGHAARRWAGWAMVLIVVEALLGAGLVLLRYVEQNASIGRVFYLCLHLANTLMLVAVLELTALSARRAPRRWAEVPRLGRYALVAVMGATLMGALAALGDTLYPAISMLEGVRQEFSAGSPVLLQLRLAHPLLAVAAGFLALAAAQRALGGRWRRALVLAVIVQLAAGTVDVLLLAPVWMQVLHLGLAEGLWLMLVAAAFEGTGPEE
jgi:heme A synthase